MNDLPRLKLAEIIHRYGRPVIQDPRRVEALLRDYAGQHRREINAIVSALRERVPDDLLGSHGGAPTELLLGRLAARLDENLGLAPDLSRWAVETWALALGVVSEADLRSDGPPPQAPAAAPADDHAYYGVLLWSSGADRAATVRAVREVTQLGGNDALALVDAAPITLIEGLARDEAEHAADTLRATGAPVDVVPSTSTTRRITRPAPQSQTSTSTPPPGSSAGPSGSGNASPGQAQPAFQTLFGAAAAQVTLLQLRHVNVRTIAGSGKKGYADGVGTAAQFNSPKGIAIDRRGVIYIADDGNRRIRTIGPDGAVATLVGNGRIFGSSRDGPLDVAGLLSPEAVDFDTQGILYVAEVGRVRRIHPNGVVDTIDHEFDAIRGLAVTADGSVYISQANCLLVLQPQGKVHRIGQGGDRPGYKDGPPDKAQFSFPCGLATDAGGNVYVADAGNHRVRKITPNGEVTTVAGDTNWLGRGGYEDGTAGQARFMSPRGICLDSAGRVFVADTDNHRIRRIDPDGMVVTVAGSGERGDSDGPVLTAQFNKPRDLALGADGTLYVVDSDNHCVRAIGP
jgi:ribosomal protein L7/L12/sugar lactone lactonase YvrE